jgi:hypothetical protein
MAYPKVNDISLLEAIKSNFFQNSMNQCLIMEEATRKQAPVKNMIFWKIEKIKFDIKFWQKKTFYNCRR